MAARPVVPTTIRTEFGDVLESDAFHAANGAHGDITYVPGYSDMRIARDQAMAEAAKRRTAVVGEDGEVRLGPLDMSKVPTLSHRLQWVRHARISGAPDNRKGVEYSNDHYRPVTKQDIGQPWFKAMPQGAHEGPNGEIRLEDVTLMVTDAANAARNAAAVQFRTNQQTRSLATESLKSLGRATRGTDPSVEVSKGETHQVGSAIKTK